MEDLLAVFSLGDGLGDETYAFKAIILVVLFFLSTASFLILAKKMWPVQTILHSYAIRRFLNKNSAALQASASVLTVVIAIPTLLFVAGTASDTRRTLQNQLLASDRDRLSQYKAQRDQDELTMPHVSLQVVLSTTGFTNLLVTNNGRGPAYSVAVSSIPGPPFDTLAQGANFTLGGPNLQSFSGRTDSLTYKTEKASLVVQPFRINEQNNVELLPRSVFRSYAYLVEGQKDIVDPIIPPGQPATLTTLHRDLPNKPPDATITFPAMK